MKINWNYPTSVWVGENRIKDLSQACKNLKISSPLFVTDEDLINLDMTKNIILELKKKFSTLAIFSNFSGNPIGENVKEGVLEFKKNKCDGVIAFDTICVFAKSLSVTNKGFFIFNILQALGSLLILPLPNQTVLG